MKVTLKLFCPTGEWKTFGLSFSLDSSLLNSTKIIKDLVLQINYIGLSMLSMNKFDMFILINLFSAYLELLGSIVKNS